MKFLQDLVPGCSKVGVLKLIVYKCSLHNLCLPQGFGLFCRSLAKQLCLMKLLTMSNLCNAKWRLVFVCSFFLLNIYQMCRHVNLLEMVQELLSCIL